jgi:hypothetical protein
MPSSKTEGGASLGVRTVEGMIWDWPRLGLESWHAVRYPSTTSTADNPRMSIFDKSITALGTADLQELLAEQAVENIRLEFKAVPPSKDEMLKKVSSFANTYGGYVVVGATEDGKGRMQTLPGVAAINGYRQQIVQWCYDGSWPPVEVFVSDPIPSPQDATKVCYVIHVPLSAEAPHFLNGRKGAYVRTDEHSQRLEPQLATYDELTHLGNRRALLVQRREGLSRRSMERFEAHVQANYAADERTKDDIGATLIVSVCPQFPSRQLIEHTDLLTEFETHHIQWRQKGFPAPNMPKISAHESMLIPGAAYFFSLLELSVWGHLFYAVEVEELLQSKDGSEQVRGIHFNRLLGLLMAFLGHANSALKVLAYDGPLLVQVQMLRVRSIPFLTFRYETGYPQGAAPFDDTLTFEVSTSSTALATSPDAISGEIAKTILLGLNWPTPALGDDAVKGLIEKAKEYSLWT